ncbi:unnamed protein product [Amoebophrya sp. A25]|nr:unnamed protein product [Amoebophrya sp. A25]|eukprot:GSA25T00014652001.1
MVAASKNRGRSRTASSQNIAALQQASGNLLEQEQLQVLNRQLAELDDLLCLAEVTPDVWDSFLSADGRLEPLSLGLVSDTAAAKLLSGPNLRKAEKLLHGIRKQVRDADVVSASRAARGHEISLLQNSDYREAPEAGEDQERNALSSRLWDLLQIRPPISGGDIDVGDEDDHAAVAQGASSSSSTSRLKGLVCVIGFAVNAMEIAKVCGAEGDQFLQLDTGAAGRGGNTSSSNSTSPAAAFIIAQAAARCYYALLSLPGMETQRGILVRPSLLRRLFSNIVDAAAFSLSVKPVFELRNFLETFPLGTCLDQVRYGLDAVLALLSRPFDHHAASAAIAAGCATTGEDVPAVTRKKADLQDDDGPGQQVAVAHRSSAAQVFPFYEDRNVPLVLEFYRLAETVLQGITKTDSRLFAVAHFFRGLMPLLVMTAQDPLPQRLSAAGPHTKASVLAALHVHKFAVERFPHVSDDKEGRKRVFMDHDEDCDKFLNARRERHRAAALAKLIQERRERKRERRKRRKQLRAEEAQRKKQAASAGGDSVGAGVGAVAVARGGGRGFDPFSPGGKSSSSDDEDEEDVDSSSSSEDEATTMELDENGRRKVNTDAAQRKRKKQNLTRKVITLSPYTGLLQQLVISCPERADFRESLISVVLLILIKGRSQKLLSRFLLFLEHMLGCEVPGKRATASEVLSAVLECIGGGHFIDAEVDDADSRKNATATGSIQLNGGGDPNSTPPLNPADDDSRGQNGLTGRSPASPTRKRRSSNGGSVLSPQKDESLLQPQSQQSAFKNTSSSHSQQMLQSVGMSSVYRSARRRLNAPKSSPRGRAGTFLDDADKKASQLADDAALVASGKDILSIERVSSFPRSNEWIRETCRRHVLLCNKKEQEKYVNDMLLAPDTETDVEQGIRSNSALLEIPPARADRLIRCILARTRDTIPNVRVKALQSIALALNSNEGSLLRTKRSSEDVVVGADGAVENQKHQNVEEHQLQVQDFLHSTLTGVARAGLQGPQAAVQAAAQALRFREQQLRQMRASASGPSSLLSNGGRLVDKKFLPAGGLIHQGVEEVLRTLPAEQLERDAEAYYAVTPAGSPSSGREEMWANEQGKGPRGGKNEGQEHVDQLEDADGDAQMNGATPAEYNQGFMTAGGEDLYGGQVAEQGQLTPPPKTKKRKAEETDPEEEMMPGYGNAASGINTTTSSMFHFSEAEGGRDWEMLRIAAQLFTERMKDDKPTVRQNALKFLDTLLPTLVQTFEENSVHTASGLQGSSSSSGGVVFGPGGVAVGTSAASSSSSTCYFVPMNDKNNTPADSTTAPFFSGAEYLELESRALPEQESDQAAENLWVFTPGTNQQGINAKKKDQRVRRRVYLFEIDPRYSSSQDEAKKQAEQQLLGGDEGPEITYLSPLVLFPLESVVSSAGDEAVSVRKSAVSTLSLLLRTAPHARCVREAWSHAVLPCVMDVEVSVADLAVSEINKAIFQQIVSTMNQITSVYNKRTGKYNQHTSCTTANRIEQPLEELPPVYRLLEELDQECTEYMQRAVGILLKIDTQQVKKLVQTLECILGSFSVMGRSIPIGVLDLFDEATSKIVKKKPAAGEDESANTSGTNKKTSANKPKGGPASKLLKATTDEDPWRDVKINMDTLLMIWDSIFRNEEKHIVNEVHEVEDEEIDAEGAFAHAADSTDRKQSLESQGVTLPQAGRVGGGATTSTNSNKGAAGGRQNFRVLQRMIRILGNCHAMLSLDQKGRLASVFRDCILARPECFATSLLGDVITCLQKFLSTDETDTKVSSTTTANAPPSLNKTKASSSSQPEKSSKASADSSLSSGSSGRVGNKFIGADNFSYDFQPLVTQCMSSVQEIAEERTGFDEPESRKRLTRHVFLLGELALIDVCFSPSPATTIAARSSTRNKGVLNKKASALFTAPDLVKQLRGICEGKCVRDEGRSFADIPEVLRGHAFVAFGKLCLRDEGLAKRSIDMMVHFLLEHQQPVVVKNNILILLGDLATVHTSLVDRFVPLMTDFLGHPSGVLRQNAVLILSSLLAEDFIKFKGNVTYRLVFLLADMDKKIRDFVEAVFLRILLPRNRRLFQQNFLDILCGLNNFTALKQHRQTTAANKGFNLQKSPARRFQIYSFMLKIMPHAEKWEVAVALVRRFLRYWSDEMEPVDQLPIPIPGSGGAGAIIDTLALLQCKEMRACFSQRSYLNSNAAGDDDVGDQASAAAASRAANQRQAEIAKNKLLASVVKKTVLDTLVPIFASIRLRMLNQQSPLLEELSRCMIEICAEFRDDLRENLDPSVASEILFDMEQEERRDPSFGKFGRRLPLEKLVFHVDKTSKALLERHNKLFGTSGPGSRSSSVMRAAGHGDQHDLHLHLSSSTRFHRTSSPAERNSRSMQRTGGRKQTRTMNNSSSRPFVPAGADLEATAENALVLLPDNNGNAGTSLNNNSARTPGPPGSDLKPSRLREFLNKTCEDPKSILASDGRGGGAGSLVEERKLPWAQRQQQKKEKEKEKNDNKMKMPPPKLPAKFWVKKEKKEEEGVVHTPAGASSTQGGAIPRSSAESNVIATPAEQFPDEQASEISLGDFNFDEIGGTPRDQAGNGEQQREVDHRGQASASAASSTSQNAEAVGASGTARKRRKVMPNASRSGRATGAPKAKKQGTKMEDDDE